MSKIDRRRHYIMVFDTETVNTLTNENGKLDMSNALVYDVGYCIMDTRWNVYLEKSFVNKDIFYHEQELMQSAYYAKKIPMYKKDIQEGKRIVRSTYEIKREMYEDMKTYGVKEVCAHNARFDINALNNTTRWTTKSKFRYWFPFGTEVWDSMKMAQSVILKMPTYKRFCVENDYMTKNNQMRKTAEILYRFISKNNEFQESHTGLEDVQIEREIIKYCYRQKKPMKKVLYAGA